MKLLTWTKFGRKDLILNTFTFYILHFIFYIFLSFLFVVLLSVILTSCAGHQRATGKQEGALPSGGKPNILFILVDDLGKEWISAYGADSISTPAIDRMARQGMMFHNAWSMPQCTPTRVSLLTGQYPWRTGWVNHWDVPRWGHGYFDWRHYKTFATYLREAGYRTAAAGKWQINDFRLTPDAMVQHGFDEWLMWTGYEAGVPASVERYWDPYLHSQSGSRTYEGAFGPDLFTDFLIDFMRRHKDHPMLLYYPMVLTHGPLTHTPDEPDARGRERHHSMVRYTDKLVGKLLSALDELGIAEKTMVVFTTDNGSDASITGSRNGRPAPGRKGRKEEAGVCEPFIVRWPGKAPAGSMSYALTDFTDLFPTFLDVAGLRISDPEVDGVSLAPVLLGREEDTPREWIMALGHGPACLDEAGVRGVDDYADRVIRDKVYKAWTGHDSRVIRLHRLDQDPYEEINLLDGPLGEEDRQALEKFQSVLAKLPQRDARPQYEPRAANAWDVAGMDCR